MESPENKEGKFVKIAGVTRYFIGLALLAFVIIGVPMIAHQSPFLILMFIFSLPAAVIFDPLIIIAVYFMFSTKFNWRIDITVILIAVVCLIAIFQLISTPQTGPENNTAGATPETAGIN